MNIILINNANGFGGTLQGRRIGYAILKKLDKLEKLGKVYIFEIQTPRSRLESDISASIKISKYIQTKDDYVKPIHIGEVSDPLKFYNWLIEKAREGYVIIRLDNVYFPIGIPFNISIKQAHGGHRELITSLCWFIGHKILKNYKQELSLDELIDIHRTMTDINYDITYRPRKALERLQALGLKYDDDICYNNFNEFPCKNNIPCVWPFKRRNLDEVVNYEQSENVVYISEFRRSLEHIYNPISKPKFKPKPHKEIVAHNGMIGTSRWYKEISNQEVQRIVRNFFLKYWLPFFKRKEYNAIVLNVGRWHIEKGPLDTLLALWYISTQYPDIKVVYIAHTRDLSLESDKWLYDFPLWLPGEIRKEFKEKFIGKNVDVYLTNLPSKNDIWVLALYEGLSEIGRRLEVPVYYSHPSHSDDYGNGVAECIIAGIMPITYNWQGPKEVVEQYGGFKVCPGDYKGIAEIIANGKTTKIYPERVKSIEEQAEIILTKALL